LRAPLARVRMRVGQAMSSTAPDVTAPIRHSGRIARGVTITWTFEPRTGELTCETQGRTADPRALQRYRALRHAFLERVATALGSSVTLIELDGRGGCSPPRVIDALGAWHT
jgi:hypothetical protein